MARTRARAGAGVACAGVAGGRSLRRTQRWRRRRQRWLAARAVLPHARVLGTGPTVAARLRLDRVACGWRRSRARRHSVGATPTLADVKDHPVALVAEGARRNRD
eukprot:SAG31_NODE_2174_length_6257_cov_1.750244_4_plen_105_part_00